MHTIECFLTIAEKHGGRAAPHHRVADLQDFLRAMWEILTPTQRWDFAQSARVREIVDGAGVDVAELPECADPPDATPWCERCQSYHGPKAAHVVAELPASLVPLFSEFADAEFEVGEWTSDDERTMQEVSTRAERARAALYAEIHRLVQPRTAALREVLALTNQPQCLADALDAIREIARKELGE